MKQGNAKKNLGAIKPRFLENPIKNHSLEVEYMTVGSNDYEVVRLLGKGKGGYSYLVTDGAAEYVLKQIHHEPCAYYRFGDKLAAELNDYERLKKVGILMPQLLRINKARERILKEYIPGKTAFELVKQGTLPDSLLLQVREMCERLYAARLNIDYFPTNFVVNDSRLYYIDYECNEYMDEWNFENWGQKYWSQTPEFLRYLEENPAP